MATISPSTAEVVRRSGAIPHAEYLLEVAHVRKAFPGVLALDDVAVPPEARPCARADGRERRRQVDADEDHRRHLHARLRLVQAQGPGDQAHFAARCAAIRHRDDPSGAQPDGLYDGRRKHLASPRAAQRPGLRQSPRDAAARPRDLFDRLEIDIDPEIEVRDLSVASRQMVEIAKAVSYDSDILIMDEPTSAITEKEVAHLFRIIRALKARGQGHRLHHPQDERALRDRRRSVGVPRRPFRRRARGLATSPATTSSS